MSVDLESVIHEVEDVVNAARRPVTNDSLTTAEVKAQVLSAYATYKIQEQTMRQLGSQVEQLAMANAQQQTSLQNQLKTIKEMKQQTLWTKRLALVTLLVAAGTFLLAAASLIK